MFLSIVVPVYNAELYLEECLHSLFTQDLPQTDYEVICVDDGSTDKSGFILKFFSEKHQNLTIVTQENSGVATARNTGLCAARGDYSRPRCPVMLYGYLVTAFSEWERLLMV